VTLAQRTFEAQSTMNSQAVSFGAKCIIKAKLPRYPFHSSNIRVLSDDRARAHASGRSPIKAAFTPARVQRARLIASGLLAYLHEAGGKSGRTG